MFHRMSVMSTLFISGFMLCTSLQADVLGFRAGAVSWNQAWDGDIRAADLGTNVRVEEEPTVGFFASLDFPIPFVPSIKIQSTPLNTDGEVTEDFEFDGDQVNTNSAVNLDITQQDLIVYSQLLDNWVSLDLGIAARRFDAEFLITDDQVSERASATVPMVYGAARVDLPFTGVYVAGEMMALSFGDSSLQDVKLGLGYDSPYFLGAELGYRQNVLEVDDVDGVSLDFSIDGVYLALTFQI